MQFFSGCTTVEEVKARYRELARKHHPDLGGDTATMQKINAEYEQTLKQLDGQEAIGSDGKTHRYHYNQQLEKDLMEKIQALLSALGQDDLIDIILIGRWIWIVGNTKPHKEILKALECRFHGARKCWFWRSEDQRGRRSSQGSLEDLAMKYGYARFKKEDRQAKPQMKATP
jgi:curved DNA-binding protein CbpA